MPNTFKRLCLILATFLGLSQLALAQQDTGVFRYLEFAIDSVDKVVELDLSGKHIQTLPKEILQMKNLKRLRLNYCNLKALPPVITQLTQLTELELNGNKLTQLPQALGQLKYLEKLSLYDNQLVQLPKAMSQLVNLQELNLGHNALEVFPLVLKQAAKLKELNLTKNKLTQLPADIRWMRKIKYVYLQQNPWNKQAMNTLGWNHSKETSLQLIAPVPLPPPPLLMDENGGRSDALRDARHGKYRLIFYGMPVDGAHLDTYMAQLNKIGINAEHIGCVVESGMEGYNEVMGKKIAAKFGKDYWVKPRLYADSVHRHHLPHLNKDRVFYYLKDIFFSDYVNAKLPKKLVRKRHHRRQLKVQINIDSSLKNVQVKVLEGVSRKIDKACVQILKAASWTAPRSWLYLRKRGKVVFEAYIRLRAKH